MTRREFLASLGGTTAAILPLTAGAQQKAMPVIGFLNAGLPPVDRSLPATLLHQGMGELGFVEGQNMIWEYRWAERI